MAVITGTSGNDTLADTSGDDTINGLAGNDTINGGSGGSDVVNGGDGRDTLAFMAATSAVVVDFVAGTAGTTSFTNIEKVVTGDFNDQLTGDGLAQNLTARAGMDTLAGGGGFDTLWGGAGADTFVFREMGTANADSIADWTSGSDTLLLDGAVMTALGASGDFTAGDARFWASSTGTAHDADDRIIYNSTTRQIFYDADGNGSGAAQLIATLQSGATLVATDIVVEGATPPPPGDQTINGTAGNDSLVGGAGKDTINGFDGADTIDGGAGTDSVVGGAGNDTVSGGSGNDSIIGGEGVDKLEGSDGNDTLVGGEANFYEGAGDTLDGGLGDDRFVLGRYDHNVLLIDGGGVDTVVANSGWWTLATGFENLELGFDWNTDEGAAFGTGNAANNIITGFSRWWVSNVLDGADGNDTLIGGDGDDVFKFEAGSGNYGTDFVDGRGGFDTLSFSNAPSAIVVDWRIGSLSGGGSGGSGSATFANIELIEGSAFADHITGPSGSGWGDGYYYDEWDYYDDWYYSGPQVRAGAGNDTLLGGDNYDYLFGEEGNDHLSAGIGGAHLDGGAGADTLIGGAGYDEIYAALGSDSISAGGSTDYVYLYTDGQDTVDGGEGTDYLYLHTFAQSAVVVDLGAGTAQGGAASGGGGATLLNIEGVVSGAFDDRLSGNGAANYFSSGLGNDSLLGGGGNDTLYAGYWSDTAEDDDWVDGGAGNDYLYGGSGVDRFVFSVAAGEGNADFIDGFTSGEDQLRLDPAVYTQLGESGRFGWGDERFYAAAGASSGHDASDRLIFDTTNGYFYYDADGSGAGAALRIATLWGPLQATDIYVGFGEDTGSIRGTSGNDTLVGASGDDLIEGLGGNDSIEGLGGRDGILGGSGNDNLSGGAGADSLDGGLGSDTMAGGLDDDIFIVDSFGDVVTEFAGGGANDEVQVSFSYSLPAWVENLTFTGSASTVGDGNNLDNIIAGNGAANTLRGGLGNDMISGEAGRDWLYGEGGDDVLRGGMDGDQLIGGDGNDFLEGGDGLDALYGQAGNDTLHGGAGEDYFFMLAIPGDYGNDVIDGGAGRDILMFDFGYAESSVVVDFAAGTVTGGGPGGLGSATVMNVEQVQATPFADRLAGGSGDDILTGMDGNDTLTGAGGDNSLGGGRGADLMTGGDGNDTMHGNGSDATEADGAVDTILGGLGDDLYYVSSEDVISDSGGIDGVVAYESWTLADDFENLYFAPGDFSGIGNSKDNWIAAGTGTQWLDGQAGSDTVSGGEGNDTLLGGAGNDFLSAGFGFDRLEGGAGNDTMVGLYDANTLAFSHFGAANADVIREFHLGSNNIELDGAAFTNIGPSSNFTSSDARFHAAPGAAGGRDLDDRVIYNATTGQLWYDADGSGSGGAQLIATLEGAPSLSASQISVINGRVSPAGQVINGTSGADTLSDTAGDDTINGLAGNDTINGGTGGSDVVNGGDGRDSLAFMTATSAVVVDFVAGTAGNTSFTNIERVITGDFNDTLTGNAAAQNLTSRAGSDTLAGAGGVDTLWGGAGADTFIFREAGAANADTIADWTSGSDEIALDNAIMNTLGGDGDFVAGDARFWASSTGTAHDANDRVIYNTNTRSLYYDADGTGSGAAQLIATVQAVATIAATDISII